MKGGKAILVSSFPSITSVSYWKKSAKPHVTIYQDLMRMLITLQPPTPLCIFIHMPQLKIDTVFWRSLPEIIETRGGQKGRKKGDRMIQADKAVLGCD